MGSSRNVLQGQASVWDRPGPLRRIRTNPYPAVSSALLSLVLYWF